MRQRGRRLCGVWKDLTASGDCCFGLDARMNLVVVDLILSISCLDWLYSYSMRTRTNRCGKCGRGKRIQEMLVAWRGRDNDMFMRDEARANRQSFRRHAEPFDLLSTPDNQQLDHMPLSSSNANVPGTITSSSAFHTPLLLIRGR